MYMFSFCKKLRRLNYILKDDIVTSTKVNGSGEWFGVSKLQDLKGSIPVFRETRNLILKKLSLPGRNTIYTLVYSNFLFQTRKIM